MADFHCPRCSTENSGVPYLLHTTCYTRCDNGECQIGIELKSSLFGRDLEPVKTYIPHGSSVSPKTDRVLDSARIYNGSRGAIKLFYYMGFPPAKRALRRRRKRHGTLKEDVRNSFG